MSSKGPALIVVHGVADQKPAETARSVALLFAQNERAFAAPSGRVTCVAGTAPRGPSASGDRAADARLPVAPALCRSLSNALPLGSRATRPRDRSVGERRRRFALDQCVLQRRLRRPVVVERFGKAGERRFAGQADDRFGRPSTIRKVDRLRRVLADASRHRAVQFHEGDRAVPRLRRAHALLRTGDARNCLARRPSVDTLTFPRKTHTGQN